MGGFEFVIKHTAIPRHNSSGGAPANSGKISIGLEGGDLCSIQENSGPLFETC